MAKESSNTTTNMHKRRAMGNNLSGQALKKGGKVMPKGKSGKKC